MSARPPPFSPRHRLLRWWLPVALLALTPKCVLCLLAYAGLGTVLGLGGRELCGGPASAGDSWPLTLVVVSVVGVGLGIFGRKPARPRT